MEKFFARFPAIGKLFTGTKILFKGSVPLILEGFENDSAVGDLLSEEYSKEAFGLNYPLLAKDGELFEKRRYYVSPLTICGARYYLCNNWFERNRAALEAWIAQHEEEPRHGGDGGSSVVVYKDGNGAAGCRASSRTSGLSPGG